MRLRWTKVMKWDGYWLIEEAVKSSKWDQILLGKEDGTVLKTVSFVCEVQSGFPTVTICLHYAK